MISCENATKLRDAGFTQPEKALYQTWYDRKGGIWQISTLAPHAEPVAICLTDTRWEFLHDTNGFIFAPTAVEILATMDTYVTDGRNIFRMNAADEIEASVHEGLDIDNAAALCYLEEPSAFEKGAAALNEAIDRVAFYGDRRMLNSLSGKETIDGVALVSGPRFGSVFNVPGTENGIYTIGVDPAYSDSLAQTVTMLSGPDGVFTKMWVEEDGTHGLDKVSIASVLDAVSKFKPTWIGDPDRSILQKPMNSDGTPIFPASDEKEIPSRKEIPSNPTGFAGTYSPLPEVERICKNCKHWTSYEQFYEDPLEDSELGFCAVEPRWMEQSASTWTCAQWEAK